MISLKDYTFLYSDYFNNFHHNQNHLKSEPPFFYLYPSENSPPNKRNFTNEKEELFIVTQLENLQECETLIELIKSPEKPIISPSQEFCIVEHKNPNAEKRFLVISSDLEQNKLTKVAENHFFENVNVPSEEFCTYLIERILEIHRSLEEKGLRLKIITPEHILVNQNQIFLNFPFPHDVFDWSPNTFLEQLEEEKLFCAPEILKALSALKKVEESQGEKTVNLMEKSDPMSYSGNYENKDFKKGILYSLGLTILYCFGFHVPLQDRLIGLRNPSQVNSFLDQLRKEIKLHHDGKFISKLLKLMLEHSESLRDTISTFTYKMKSVQFQLLRKSVEKNTRVLTNEENAQTESEGNSQPFLNTTSGKKTIDIRISSMSNASSMINKSWLSVSQQNLEGKFTSPSEMNKSNQEEKEKDRTIKSKKSIVSNELNEIEEIKEPSSPIEFDIEWDEDSSIRGSSKSSKDKSKSSSDKEKKDKKPQLLNKISEKEEGEEEFEMKENIEKQIKNEIEDVHEEINENITNLISERHMSPRKIIAFKNEITIDGHENHVSKSEIGTKTDHKNFAINKSILFETDKRISGTESKKLSSKDFDNEPEDNRIPSFETIESKKEEISQNEKAIELVKFKTFAEMPLYKNVPKEEEVIGQKPEIRVSPPVKKPLEKEIEIESESTFVNEPSTMVILNKESRFSEVFESELNNSMNLEVNAGELDDQNESIIFEEPFFNDEELKMEQKLIKEKKNKEKEKLTERKKDQYNERSKAILFTLIVICGVFKFIDILLSKGSVQTSKS